jgi:hypothetical protein
MSADPVVDRLTATVADAVSTNGSTLWEPNEEPPGTRRLRLTPASRIKPRPVFWLWDLRVALGTLGLLAGREGIGKSSIAIAIAAQITRGQLPGVYFGEPRAVIIAATEDSWAHTIVPRLMAAGADLDRIYRVDVTVTHGFDSALMLPSDLSALERSVAEVDAALILLDPLLSRLDSSLDSHKDAEVRIALEPLVALADRSAAAVLGLIHVNKSGGQDPLDIVMGSRAFAAVARSVLFAMKGPDWEEDGVYLLGQPKNNLGRSDLPTLTYRIEGAHVADTDEGAIWTSRLDWIGESELSIREALVAAGESSDARTATTDAAAWLKDYLTEVGGSAESAAVKKRGIEAGHADRTLKRAAQQLHLVMFRTGFPSASYWRLPAGGGA